jgi:hypothetical protein
MPRLAPPRRSPQRSRRRVDENLVPAWLLSGSPNRVTSLSQSPVGKQGTAGCLRHRNGRSEAHCGVTTASEQVRGSSENRARSEPTCLAAGQSRVRLTGRGGGDQQGCTHPSPGLPRILPPSPPFLPLTCHGPRFASGAVAWRRASRRRYRVAARSGGESLGLFRRPPAASTASRRGRGAGARSRPGSRSRAWSRRSSCR